MARLRVRLELNRRSAGVPLDKLASVVEETRKFFHLLAEDVHIDVSHAEWVASDFDPESLNFTAEYSGAVTSEQVRAFGAAFAGATSLRRATIGQFTRIADFLGEDELVGFGLFQSDTETEPSEWRCLSKRDAQRFGQEIQLLAQATSGSQPETSLPAVMNGSIAGRRLFKDRREREALAADPGKLIREVESSLSRRIGLLEGEVAEHSRRMKETREIGPGPDEVDERFKRLLSAMEMFWTQGPRQMPLLAAPAMAAPAMAAPAPVVVPVSAPAVPEPALPEPDPVEVEAPPVAPVVEEMPLNAPPAKGSKRWWMMGGIAAAAVALAFAIPGMQREWSFYTVAEKMPVVHLKPPAPPALPAAKISEATPQMPSPAQPKPDHQKSADRKASKHPEPFQGPQIALAIPADFRTKVPSEARVQVIVAIDDQGNVTKAEVASTQGKGARLLAKEALAAARRSRFRPAREGERAVESQMVLTYLFKPDSAEF